MNHNNYGFIFNNIQVVGDTLRKKSKSVWGDKKISNEIEYYLYIQNNKINFPMPKLIDYRCMPGGGLENNELTIEYISNSNTLTTLINKTNVEYYTDKIRTHMINIHNIKMAIPNTSLRNDLYIETVSKILDRYRDSNLNDNVDEAPFGGASSNPLKKGGRLFDNNVDEAPFGGASSNPLKKGGRLFDNNVDEAPFGGASSNPLKKGGRLFDNNVDEAPFGGASSNPLKKGGRLFDNNVYNSITSVNNKKIKKIEYYCETIYTTLLNIVGDRNEYSLIHGDIHLGNILEGGTGELYFIDPRGYFGNSKLFGLEEYDYAKLLFGISGYSIFDNLTVDELQLNGGNLNIAFIKDYEYIYETGIFTKADILLSLSIWLGNHSCFTNINKKIMSIMIAFYYCEKYLSMD